MSKPLGEQLREKAQSIIDARKASADDREAKRVAREKKEGAEAWAKGEKKARETLLRTVEAKAGAGLFHVDILVGTTEPFNTAYEVEATGILKEVNFRFYNRSTYPTQYQGCGFSDNRSLVIERRLLVWWGDTTPTLMPDETRG